MCVCQSRRGPSEAGVKSKSVKAKYGGSIAAVSNGERYCNQDAGA
jgi:hypothetical protein